MVGGAQVLGVCGRERVREQVHRATSGLGRVVHAQRPGFDLARITVGSPEETVKGYRRTGQKTRRRNGRQRIQTPINIIYVFNL